MRIVSVCVNDWANYSYEISESMKLVGLDAETFKTRPHAYQYRKEATIASIKRIQQELARADVIMVMHSAPYFYQFVKDLRKPIIVWHTGTGYRQSPEKFNDMWNPIASKVVCCLGEFMFMGCKDPIYFNMTVDTSAFRPNFEPTSAEFLKVGHYPSKPEVKGTEAVSEIFRSLHNNNRLKFDIDNTPLRHNLFLNRMAGCDVYVEMMATEQRGKPYGSFGTTALEAAALGKIVITNNVYKDIYREYYGDCKLIIANSSYEIREHLRGLSTLNNKTITEWKKESAQWVDRNHSRYATGQRMLNLLESIL